MKGNSSFLTWRVWPLSQMNINDYFSFRSVKNAVAQWYRLCIQCIRCKSRGFDPWVRRSPGEGNGNPLQYSCLENPMDRGPWSAAVQGIARVRYDLVTKQQQKGTNWLADQIQPAQGTSVPIPAMTPQTLTLNCQHFFHHELSFLHLFWFFLNILHQNIILILSFLAPSYIFLCLY